MIKALFRFLLRLLYRVEVRGLEHYRAAGPRVLVVANHTSYLDAVLLAAFLPDDLSFAVNTRVSRRWLFRPFIALVHTFVMDPTNPVSLKSLIRYLRGDRKVVIFPEGRITVTGSLMKIYYGPGMVADRAGATVLPVRIDGAQYTPFSRLRGRVRTRWFPRITLTLLPPQRIAPPPALRGRARRNHAGRRLQDIMTEMMFASSDTRRTLFRALLDARAVHGPRHVVMEDIQRQPLDYRRFILRILILADLMRPATRRGEYTGLMLPNTNAAALAFFALHAAGRVPAMLNFTAGPAALRSACRTAGLKVVYTSREFVRRARLERELAALEEVVQVVFLEDLAARAGLAVRLRGLLRSLAPRLAVRRWAGPADPGAPAVVLFTSGSEGAPKGVVLSHANLLANCAQVAARMDYQPQDRVLNALPVFHAFGLTAGTLLPLFSGMRIFFYPSPLHYRIVPEMAYDTGATILFGTDTFLRGYARCAHPYDFYSVRYVFAGAEKLQEATRRLWSDKFGVRILEGYGATEAAPVIASNSPMDHRPGSVGRLLPGIRWHLEPVPGVARGGRLEIRGPNVMLGYLRPERPGVIAPPATARGPGWDDTGDIAWLDEDGFLYLEGRARRFAKVGGEMVSLAAAEALAAECWPEARHAVVAEADPRRGEVLVLVTEAAGASRRALAGFARARGASELLLPRRVVPVRRLPLLGSGKVDYAEVARLAAAGTQTRKRA